MRHAEAIITSCMRYAVTFDPSVFLKNIEVRMRKGITAHARLKKGAYHPRNTKIHSSRRNAFFLRKKRHHANLRYVGIRSIPFSRRSARWPEPRAYIYTTFAHVCDALEAVL